MLQYYDYFWSSILRKGHSEKRDELVKCIHAKIRETNSLVAKVLKDLSKTKLENRELRRELLLIKRSMSEQKRANTHRASTVYESRPSQYKERKSNADHVFQLAAVDSHT